MCNDSKVKLLYSVCTLIWTIIHYNISILRGRWMLESDWLTNVLRCTIIFRETHGERSSRQLSRPHYSSVSLRQMISLISKVALQFCITLPNYFCYFKGCITVLYHFAKLFLLFQRLHYSSVSLCQIISVISKVALQFCITLPNYFCYFKGCITVLYHFAKLFLLFQRLHYSSVSLCQIISVISKVALQFCITLPNYFCYFKGRITVPYHFAKLFLLFQRLHYSSVSLCQIISVISKVL